MTIQRVKVYLSLGRAWQETIYSDGSIKYGLAIDMPIETARFINSAQKKIERENEIIYFNE